MLTETAPDPLAGLVVVRGGGAALRWWRLPRRSSVGVGQADRHGLWLPASWVPRDLAVLTPVPDGWLVANGRRTVLQVESEWVRGGRVVFQPGGVAVLQAGETRLSWPEADGPVSLSVNVRTRRPDDHRVAYAVDRRLPAAGDATALAARPATETGLPASAAVPLSLSLRYWLAVLFRHLLEGGSEPVDLVAKRAAYLGMPEEALAEAAHRHRRRLNAERGLELGDLYDLGVHLVASGELTGTDLDP